MKFEPYIQNLKNSYFKQRMTFASYKPYMHNVEINISQFANMAPSKDSQTSLLQVAL
jgi:hypothetical protein